MNRLFTSLTNISSRESSGCVDTNASQPLLVISQYWKQFINMHKNEKGQVHYGICYTRGPTAILYDHLQMFLRMQGDTIKFQLRKIVSNRYIEGSIYFIFYF